MTARIRGPLRLLTAVALCFAILVPAGFAASQDDAVKFLRKLCDEAVDLAQSGQKSPEEREAKLRDLLEAGFDVGLIGRFVLGRYWNTASEEQRDEYMRLFKDMIILTFARRFQDYNGETFEITGTNQRGENDYFVNSVINRPSSPDVKVDWRVRCTSQCRIIDVVAEGISQVQTYRSEYGAIIQNGGGSVNSLLDALRNHVNQLEAG
ncbi:MAG: ABC transporter substrate-binding protein [Proteobacteria bacterium]|nr:ABC transporter substrate-binding protein [Pseudomonadota bacterium]